MPTNMGRWTQFEEDAYRLPEGMKRIGYDADRQVYIFRSRGGTLYQGEPGADYGILTPIDGEDTSRPGAFESDEPQNTTAPANSEGGASTFHDILPANLITAAKAPIDKPLLPSTPPRSLSNNHEDNPPPRSRFVDAVRRSALPRMQGVVHNLRRSMTSVRRENRSTEEDATLLHRGPSDLSRSASMSTARTSITLVDPMSVGH